MTMNEPFKRPLDLDVRQTKEHATMHYLSRTP
jgi:hypothetical protein